MVTLGTPLTDTVDTAGYDENLDRSIETDSLSEIEERIGYSYEELGDFIGGGNNASFSSTIAFSATDENTVAWTSGTISFASGLTTATISSGNTGNISARTYIYWDPEIEVTLQSTTTASESVEGGRTLLAIATNNADTNGKTQIDTFGTSGSYPVAVSTTHLEAGVMTVPLVMTPASDTTALVVVNQNDGTNIFTVDSTNARVGIANTAPATSLDIFSNSSTQALRLRGLSDTANTGEVDPSDDAAVGYVNAENVYTSDNNYATLTYTGTSARTLIAKFPSGFSLGAVEIVGIKVTIETKKDVSVVNPHHNVSLTKSFTGTPVYTDAQDTGYLTTSDADYNLGGEDDLWGTTWTPSNFNDGEFAVRLETYRDSSSGTIYVDHVAVTVYYASGDPSTTKIADFYVGSDGSLVADLTSGNSTSQFFDFRSEDNEYGLVLRESDGTGTTVLANFYVVDATPDYLSINLGATDANALNITSGDDIGFGTATPIGKLEIKQEISTGTITPSMVITSVAHTALTASTERTEINLNLSATQQFATGALTTQRAMRIQAPTYAFVGASTLTNAYTVEISGAPIAGTNATITNSYALAVGGKTLLSDKVIFTQTDGNEYIDSLNDGYMDYGATTAHRFNNNINVTGNITTSTPAGYAEMYMYGNTTPCPIDTANVYHAIYHTFGNNDGTLAPLQDATYFTYKAGIGYAVASVATYDSGNKIQCTVTAGHALLAGEPVTITGSSVAGYNGTYLIDAAGITATEFVVTVAYSATATASVRRPGTLKCLVTGYYRAGFHFSGTAANPNDNIKIELNKDLITLDNLGSRGIWSSSSKFQTISSSGFTSLTAGEYMWASVKNYSGTGDFTFYSGSVNLNRLL